MWERFSVHHEAEADQYSICGKTRGGQQCIFYFFFTKSSGGQEKLEGGERHQM